MINKKAPNPIDIHVGARVRLRRLMLGLSQEKLGEGLGITFQQVQKYEKGTNRVGASRLQAISTILDVKPSFFFEGIDSDQAPSSGAEIEVSGLNGFISSKEGVELNRAFAKIQDANTRKKIVALVRALANVADEAEG